MPVLVGPTGIQDTNQPVFEWTNNPNSKITSYELIMFNNGEPYSKTIYPLDQLTITGNKIVLDKDETFGVGNFSWAVRYILSDGTISEWCVPFVFNILPDVAAQTPGAATAIQPAGEATPEPTQPVEEATATPESNGPQVSALAVGDSNTYYVSPSGSDSNPGTQSAPWKTIGYAANRMSAGKTLYVRGGTYRESFTISVSGTSSSPINIEAYPGETPVIDGNNYQLPTTTWAAMVKLAGSYIKMSGFEVRYTNWMAVVITGSNNVVSNFNVHHNKENGILITGNNDTVQNSSVWMNCLSNENGVQTRSGWASGLSAARHPNNAVMRNNKVYMNYGEGLSTYEASGTIMEGNIVYDNYATNVYISDATNVVLQRNFIYN
ncbi:MAG: right-handed parallel beta-helix repeat-containing protein, partial [Anaerolineaceae bacterium]